MTSTNKQLNILLLYFMNFSHLDNVILQRIVFDNNLFTHLELLFRNWVFVLAFLKILTKNVLFITDSRRHNDWLLEFLLT